MCTAVVPLTPSSAALKAFKPYFRAFSGRGIRVWGARTLSSDPEWRYVNVRRLFNFLEESILNGTNWVVFEPNDQRADATPLELDSTRPSLRKADFQALQEEEPPEWQALFGTHAIMHVQKGAKLYLYNAVFAPRGLRTRLVHDWQWLDPVKGWQSQQRVSVNIAGGRDDGYRYYTNKTNPRPGQWQVNIQTFDGRAIGRVRFAVEQQAVPPATSLKILK